MTFYPFGLGPMTLVVKFDLDTIKMFKGLNKHTHTHTDLTEIFIYSQTQMVIN